LTDVLHELTACEQVDALASGQLSSRELTSHYLERIDRLDGPLGSFITVLADEAVAAAEAADIAQAAGEPLGVLHGLPIALKDMHAAAGMRTTFGSKVFADLVTPTDAPAIGNLRAAGAVVIGKTNVPEFGPTCYTDNDLRGPTLSPYGSGLSSSGSSGGAATAVAAGLVGLAHGSDGLGSIRTPAATCGLVGFKASRGRVAGSGAGWLVLAVEGPLARTVADAALFLDAMGGPSTTDLWRAPLPARDAFRRAAQQPVGGRLRVGRLATPRWDVDIHPDCLAALDRACALLEQSGHVIDDVDLDTLPAAGDVRPAVNAVLSTSIRQIVELMVPDEKRHLLMPYTRWLMDATVVDGVQLATAQATLARAAMQWAEMLASYDVVVTPTTTAPPVPIPALRCDDGQASLDAMARWSAFTPAANIAGIPAVSLPVHMTDDGIPIGVQLMGNAFADELVLTVAAELEQAVRWDRVHPPVWSS
jgi:amidase